MKRESESDLEYHYRLKAEREADEQRRLEEARAEARRTGKEELDHERLHELLRPWVRVLPDRRALEHAYYLLWTKVRNTEEFASHMQEMELYDGGDMHLDRDWQARDPS
jgi:hypothetical protein